MKQHVEYLKHFGYNRIQNYVEYLLNNYEFLYVQKLFIVTLPSYYKLNDGRMTVFCQIMNHYNLWYTLYL